MARKPRLHIAGGIYHVMLRGNGGQDIFLEDEDRYLLYSLLQEGVERYGHRVHGFCLMGNHLHLAVQVAEVPLSKVMQNVAFRYTRWVNRRAGRVGHLFQGRYQAIVVDGDSYMLALVRYIHLNPVRAGLVQTPEAYPWSSHRAYLGEEDLPWLTTAWVLGQFGKRVATARRRYAEFVLDGIGEGHRGEFHGGREDARVLGDERFVEQILAREEAGEIGEKMTLAEIERRVCSGLAVTARELRAPGRRALLAEGRGLVGWWAQQARCATLKEVAQRYHRDPSTLTVAVRKVAQAMHDSPAYARRVKALTREP